jgi:hypothetical protein
MEKAGNTSLFSLTYKDLNYLLLTYLKDRCGCKVFFSLHISDFFSLPCPGQLWGLPSLLSNGYQGFFSQGIKWLGLEADHSPPSSTKVKNTWSYTFVPPYVLTA